MSAYKGTIKSLRPISLSASRPLSFNGRTFVQRHDIGQRYIAIHQYFATLDRAPRASSSTPVPQKRTLHCTHTLSNAKKEENSNVEEVSKRNDAVNNTTSTPSNASTKQPNPLLPENLDYPSYIRRLTSSLPPLHRPTKDDLLALATGFWERLHIRFKWFTIRGFRRFNTDDLSAFLSWFVVGQAVWIVVGTTTFFSVVFATFNSLRMQEYVAKKISDYLTRETGWIVVFESAIVPKWKDGKISFKKTYISRHPDLGIALVRPNLHPTAHPAHSAATRLDVYHPGYEHGEEEPEPLPIQSLDDLSIDERITTFDLEVDSVDVELSFKRWLDGKGLVESAVVKGVRGIVDRRMVPLSYDPELDFASYRQKSIKGFELESLQLEDVLVTVYQPNFRPYTASIFRADFRLLRRQWFFYDLLSAKSIVGQFDNCLFSLHEPQSIGRTMQDDLQDTQWKRMSRLRIDGVSIDHLQTAAGIKDGPISWITSGKVDAVLDIKFPRDPSVEVDLSSLLSEIGKNISLATHEGRQGASSKVMSYIERIPGQRELAKPALRAPPSDGHEENELSLVQDVVINIDLRFRDLKAAVPLFTRDLSYVNNALVRPIVAFINANKTLVPIHCTVVKNLEDFDGAWTAWETGLTDAIALQVYEALAYHVLQANMNRRIKTVSAWSLQMTAQAVLATLRNIVDPISARMRDVSTAESIYLG